MRHFEKKCWFSSGVAFCCRFGLHEVCPYPWFDKETCMYHGKFRRCCNCHSASENDFPEIVTTRHGFWPFRVTETYSVRCPRCGKRTEERKDMISAMSRWNHINR